MTRTVAGAEQWARQNVTTAGGGGFYNGYNWNGMCQALMFRACGLSSSANTAYQAYLASGADNPDYSAAPRGAFHWWADHGDPDPGHVALDLDGGGTRCLMASSQLSGGEDFAPGGYCLGTQSVARYNSLSGLVYLGWTLDNVGSRMADVGTPGPGNNPSPSGYTLTADDQRVLQTLAARGGYTGPIDGVMGVNSWKGVQTAVQGYGYTGPVDGVPGTNTYKAIQSLAQDGGYTGPVDGVLGPNTILGVKNWLVSHPPGGTPGPGPAPNPPAGSLIYGIDVSTYQANLDFLAARSAGFRFCVVKAGGSNDGTHLPYTSPYYTRQVDAARAAGFLVGHYWMSGWGTASGDAAHFLAHLHDYRPGDPLMIDVEGIDGSPVWSDAQTAAFISAVKTALGATPFLYTYSSLLRSRTWTQTQATGAKLWIAHYDVAPGSPNIGTAYPAWAIHQYSSSGTVKGVTVDLNVAKPDAFGTATLPPPGPNPAPDPVPDIPLADGVTVQRVAQLGGYVGPLDGVLGPNTWKGVQTLLKQLGLYTGPVDGIPGTNTYKGLQLLAQRGGYTGPIDGVPGPNTYAGLRGYLSQVTGGTVTISAADAKTLQQLAQRGGYTGPVDGVLGVNSWKGVQTVLARGYYTGPIDGVPGPNTYTGLQRLAADYGYTGPIDGVPGPNTFAAIRTYLTVTSGGPGAISTADQITLQKIGVGGGYTGPLDGALGVNSWKGVQTVLRGYGYTGPLDGAPGSSTYKGLQTLAAAGGYTGPIDGVMGVNSWKGVQTVMRRFGYTGPIDGVPGANTYAAMQRMAKVGGYTGPADGVLGAYSWRGIQACLRGSGYSGLIDGLPGAGTYTALQRLAQTGGYTGPVDGVPGPNTYRALANLV